MDDPAMQPTSMTPVPSAVADVMRRVQAELRSGIEPTFESLLAFGEPRSR